MKKLTRPTKLQLTSQTIRSLQHHELAAAGGGGGPSAFSNCVCETRNPFICWA